ncbi:hypothetical protein SAMN04488135_103409 [Pollutimonas bauzanensis]|uniref:Thiolase, N-terminal domain n=1 Tax=Pollutimonas bauzanensis TaxID=658167 RepID=A0A1M5TKH3_9BURK|nr:hypothetical protein SAMN04488135_103409 [Pollutimonas bauzanensis]
MTINGKAYIVGAYEHPTRHAPDASTAQLHAEVALGALQDAGLERRDVDGYFCSGDAPGMGPASMLEYLNLSVRHADSTDIGGASYLSLASHAAQAIAAGKCDIALVTLAGRPRSEGVATGLHAKPRNPAQPDFQWEYPCGLSNVNGYGIGEKNSGAFAQPRNRAILGGGQAREILDTPLRLVPAGALVSARDLPVLRRRNRLAGSQRQSRHLYIQRNASGGAAFCRRVCDPG